MSEILTIELSIKEIERYAHNLIELIEPLSQDQLWSKNCGIPNSVGTIARHLTGNLNHYFGAGILRNGYIRDRDREFTETDVLKATVSSDLYVAVEVAKKAVGVIDEKRVTLRYHTPCGEKYESLTYHILRLATHFSLHYGQAYYATKLIGYNDKV